MEHRRVLVSPVGMMLAALGAWLFAAPAVADPGRPADQRGSAEYHQYCASCHGVNGEGDGPMAAVLTVKPANLTLLGQRYGMPLPRPKLIAFIDGRTPVRGHGSEAMPVWGKRLYDETAGSQAREGHVRGTILVIIDYLETIQKPAAERPGGGTG